MSERHHKAIAQGAFVNILGIIGKALSPLFFILITRLYSPEIMGVYYLAFVIIDVALSLTVSGFNDGILMYTSHFVEDKEKENDFYNVLANGIVVTFIISILLIIFSQIGSDLILAKYPQRNLLPQIQTMAFSIPFSVFSIIVIAATKSLHIMKWDAIITGFLNQILLIIFSLTFYFLGIKGGGLALSYLFTSITTAIFSFFIFNKYFSLKKLIRHIFNIKFFPKLITFAIPQNLNMTFNQMVANFDVMMLGYFGLKPEMIAFYGMGSQIVRNIRQVKLAFSGSYAPVIAKLHKNKDFEGINHSFTMVSRWTATIAFPIALIVAFFKGELLLLFHNSFTENTFFMILLLIPPLLNCTVGLAGNILVMTGNSLWNLINSVAAFGLTLLANYLLIPRFGIIGAALATVIATTIVSVMQLVEAYLIVGAKIIFSETYKPYIAAAISALLLLLFSFVGGNNFFVKLVLMILDLAIFAVIIYWLKLEEEDKKIFFSKFHKRQF